jgi:hypothetical protein
MMSENPTNRDRSRHVDVKAHYLRDLVRDGHVKLIKCAGTQNVSDVLTKNLARFAFEKHREYICGVQKHREYMPFSAFFSTVDTKIAPVMDYSIQFERIRLNRVLFTDLNGSFGFDLFE